MQSEAGWEAVFEKAVIKPKWPRGVGSSGAGHREVRFAVAYGPAWPGTSPSGGWHVPAGSGTVPNPDPRAQRSSERWKIVSQE